MVACREVLLLHMVAEGWRLICDNPQILLLSAGGTCHDLVLFQDQAERHDVFPLKHSPSSKTPACAHTLKLYILTVSVEPQQPTTPVCIIVDNIFFDTSFAQEGLHTGPAGVLLPH